MLIGTQRASLSYFYLKGENLIYKVLTSVSMNFSHVPQTCYIFFNWRNRHPFVQSMGSCTLPETHFILFLLNWSLHRRGDNSWACVFFFTSIPNLFFMGPFQSLLVLLQESPVRRNGKGVYVDTARGDTGQESVPLFRQIKVTVSFSSVLETPE